MGIEFCCATCILMRPRICGVYVKSSTNQVNTNWTIPYLQMYYFKTIWCQRPLTSLMGSGWNGYTYKCIRLVCTTTTLQPSSCVCVCGGVQIGILSLGTIGSMPTLSLRGSCNWLQLWWIVYNPNHATWAP